MKIINNFILGSYISDEYFCDRVNETNRIINSMENGRNINLISHRRYGKTGLIFHILHNISKKYGYKTIYIDLLNTKNIHEFVEEFAFVVLNRLESRTTKVLKMFSKVVKGIQPSLSVNPFTGNTEVGFEMRENYSHEMSIKELFEYLNNQNEKIVIAFDEFQQILNYPEDNIEATLRKYIQQSPNLTFIYSGSQKHMLTAMFSDYSRPFYQSAEYLFLDKIDRDIYAEFIKDNFLKAKQKIDDEAISLILDLSKRHTYYTQFLCNRIFSLYKKKIDAKVVIDTMNNIIDENRPVYYTYEKILSKRQFELLKAIAKEENLTQPTSKEFIQKNNLPTPSSIKTALNAILEKEMAYEEEGVYSVYDVFFSRFLERL